MKRRARFSKKGREREVRLVLAGEHDHSSIPLGLEPISRLQSWLHSKDSAVMVEENGS